MRRRASKPIMEKKRRARINECLNTLKNLVLKANKKDPSRYSKLEKADILEMTVNHVQSLHRQEPSPTVVAAPRQPKPVPQEAMVRYQTGYSHCASAITQFLAQDPTLSSATKERLMTRLQGNLQGLQCTNTSVNSHPPGSPPPSMSPSPTPSTASFMIRPSAEYVALPPSGVWASPQTQVDCHPAPPSPPLSHTSSSIDFQYMAPSSPYHPHTPPVHYYSASPAYSFSQSPSYIDACSSRSPSPQPLDLAPIRAPESDDDNCWRPW